MVTIARKELSREIKDNKETIVNEYREFEFDKDILSNLEIIFDDWEYASWHGVNYWDDELHSIDVNDCIEELEARIEGDEENDIGEKATIAYLKEWTDFTIWI